MSTVFVAADNALGRKVVVKVLPLELAASVSVDRFKREIMVSAALQHPNIVPVLSSGELELHDDPAAGNSAARLPFFVMPFVEGESLRSRLSRGPLSVREAVSILKDVARALSYAHGRGIIHRDIKPDNILLTNGAATVTDFGVAKALSASREGTGRLTSTRTSGVITLAGTSIGTPAYMAPEQAAGDPATDHRADIYALGIVGYEMLVGTPPFHGRSPQQLLAAQLTEAPAPISTRRYDVPPALAALVMRMLEKDPSRRPRTAAEITRALDDPAVVSGTFRASAARAGARGPKRVLWALAGAGILASMAAGGAYLNRRDTASATVSAAAAQSVAVLPLVNIGQDSADASLAGGITAALTTALSRVPGIRVASGAAATAAAAQSGSPANLGKALHVGMVLEGTVQRDGDRLRVTARLFKVSDGFTVWADTYERQVTDVFKLQDEISKAILDAVSPELAAGSTNAAYAPELPRIRG
jgi:serine/threonine-protein kinase